MLFVGVDLHKQTTTLVVVDASRKLVHRRRFANANPRAMVQFFRDLREMGPFELTVEATASYEWFVQLAEPLAARVVLAHPGKLRIIAASTRKSDNLDAKVLAEMLALDQIPASYRPTPRQREHRVLVRHRQFVQRRITSVRNKLRRVLSNYNLDRRDLFTKSGLASISEMPLSGADRFCVEQLLDQWRGFRRQLLAAEGQLREFAQRACPEEQADRQILASIVGVGTVTVDVVLAELADWRRFCSLKKVVAYAGLVPGQRESAGKRKSLHIEKTGSPLLRMVLVQAAWQLVKRSPKWSAVYRQLKSRIGSKKAIIAVSRRLLTVMYSLLKKREHYQELPLRQPQAA
jgi:transposase